MKKAAEAKRKATEKALRRKLVRALDQVEEILEPVMAKAYNYTCEFEEVVGPEMWNGYVLVGHVRDILTTTVNVLEGK